MRARLKTTGLYFHDPRRDNVGVRFVDFTARDLLSIHVPASYRIEAREKTRSSYTPSLIHDDLKELEGIPSGIRDDPEFCEDTWRSTLAPAIDAFAVDERISPMSLYDVNLPPGSIAGRKYGSQRRGDVHNESCAVAEAALNAYSDSGPDYDRYSAYTIYARTQYADIIAPKVRGIFGAQDHNLRIECSCTYPFNVVLAEKSSPYRGCNYAYVYGWSLTDYQYWRRNFHLPWSGAQFAGYDWSRWDRSLEAEEIKDVFDEMKTLFRKTAHTRIDYSRDYYMRKPVITADADDETQTTGCLYELVGYGPSGSGWTHLVNNPCNHRRTNYLIKRLDLDAVGFFAQDDVLLAGYCLDRMTQSRVDTLLRPWPLAHLDVTKNRPSGNPDAVEFLSYTTPFGRIYREAFRLYCLAIYPERDNVTDPALTAARLRGISASVLDRHAFLLTTAKSIEDRFCGGRQQAPVYDLASKHAPLFRAY